MPSPIIIAFQSQRRQYYAVASNIGSGPLSYTIRLKCTAKIGNGYWESVEEDTVIRRHVLPLESRSSASSGNLPNVLVDVILYSNELFFITAHVFFWIKLLLCLILPYRQ